MSQQAERPHNSFAQTLLNYYGKEHHIPVGDVVDVVFTAGGPAQATIVDSCGNRVGVVGEWAARLRKMEGAR